MLLLGAIGGVAGYTVALRWLERGDYVRCSNCSFRIPNGERRWIDAAGANYCCTVCSYVETAKVPLRVQYNPHEER